MSVDAQITEKKEPNKVEIQNLLKQNCLKIYNQIKQGCSREICYNIYCSKNLVCKKSNIHFFNDFCNNSIRKYV